MKLYNTLTKKIETIIPVHPPNVGIYTCGPTVYDYAHVGHWFNYIRMDTLVRTLNNSDFRVNWVMNITDVGHLVSDADEGEDKLEKGAKREGKSAWEVAAFYTQDFIEGMRQLNITEPNHMPKATDHIKEQIALIQTLESKGYTYVIDDGVYFDTSKFADYTKFAQLDLDEQQSGARIAVNGQKKHPSDFALWKFSPAESKDEKRDMEWGSPWGTGFPGWHIECSAMSMKYLGETLDVHTGGIDHIPVHHTNEIAQSQAATNKLFSKYWLHSNHIMVDGKKISKSLGNGIRLKDITGKGYSLMALRLYVLESHYRKQSTFSWEGLAAAQQRFLRWQQLAALRWQTPTKQHAENEQDGDIAEILVRQKQHFINALQNDLDTPEALAAIESAWTAVENGVPSSCQTAFLSLIEAIDNFLGLQLDVISDISGEQKQLLKERLHAREQKDWQRSDELRDLLKQDGLLVRDTDFGQLWAYATIQ